MNDNSSNILLKQLNDIGILRLILNDPSNKNALSDIMMQELIDSINKADLDNSVKVIVIGSVGDVFCSGHNLKEINEARNHNDEGKYYFVDLFNKCSYLMQLIVNCSKPVIAEVNGIATAAGCQLVASCDLAISSNKAKFATPGVNIGLFCSTPMVALSRNVSKKDSMKMLLTGELISAKEAKRISLINDNVPEDQLTNSVMDLAEKISKKSSEVVGNGKEAFYNQAELNLNDAYEYTSNVMAKNILKDEAKEGINAFLNKRDPKWRD